MDRIDEIRGKLTKFAMGEHPSDWHGLVLLPDEAAAIGRILSQLDAARKVVEVAREAERDIRIGFVRCSICGGQEDTKDFDCYPALRDALAALDAAGKGSKP